MAMINNIKRALMLMMAIKFICVKAPCPFSINCNSLPYLNVFRTIDGTCNNLANPFWGSSEIPFGRRLARTPSGSAFRCPNCPRARDVSLRMNSELPTDKTRDITLMVMQWGQITDHDLVFTPEDTATRCCEDFVTPNPSATCVPIDVTGDPFYSRLSPPKRCLSFVRSRPATCAAGSDRQTINDRTAYLDASSVYGSTVAISDSLRSFSGGKLKTKVLGALESPGVSATPQSETLSCSGDNICPRSFLPVRRSAMDGNAEFFAGDDRVEEQPGLTSLHTAFLRLHNDLTDFVNCGNDELTFQVTRKIVGAIIQQITYNEFLPIVLGPTIMTKYELTLGSFSGYKTNFDASAPNVFATAAFRFGHSLIPNEYHLTSGVTVLLSEAFENHDVTLNPNSYPSHFLGAIIGQTAMPMDHIVVDAVSNKLFATGPLFEFGSDLYARNIQRGRDHGIPGYVYWYNYCHNVQITSFSQLYEIMPDRVVNAFIDLYDNVGDIDLFPAGIAEFEVPDGLIGPTFACIIGEHFKNLKFGDRFWFERTGVFTSRQVQSIRNTFLASIICLYTSVEYSQPLVFKEAISPDDLESCSDIMKNGVLNDITIRDIWGGICPSASG